MFKAIIFDYDGVLFKSEDLHLEAHNRTMQEFGITIDKQIYLKKYAGLPDKRLIPLILLDNHHSANQDEISKLIQAKAAHYQKLVEKTSQFETAEPIVPVLEELTRQNMKLAICSSSGRDLIEVTLPKLENGKLKNYFEVITSIENVAEGKPSPQGYQLTSEKLKIPPSHCLVIEDTPTGIKAAKSAGMRVFGLAGTYPKEQLKIADHVITRLSDILQFEKEFA